jgi:hypothetical protein
MPARNRYATYVLWLHFVVAEVFAIPLLFFAGRFSDWINWKYFDPTMVKMLGVALAALGIGSLLAARDPLRHRVIVQTEIVYTAGSVVVLLYRLLRYSADTAGFAWVALAAFAVFFVLFCATYPREARSDAGEAKGDVPPPSEPEVPADE